MSCTEKNPLIREGISLQSRALKALSPSFAQPDERRAADIILFARKYATYLNYYNSYNVIDGDWETLMKMDISVTLAILQTIDTRKCSDYKKLLYKRIKIADDDANAIIQFTYLFDLLFLLSKTIAEQYQFLPDSFEDKPVIKNIISSKIITPIVELKNLFEDFKNKGLIVTTDKVDGDAPVTIGSGTAFQLTDLGPGWIIPAPDIILSLPQPATVKEKIEYIINHNLFNSQVEGLLNAISAIVARVTQAFEQTLENFSSHSPHYALFLAFIKLFREAQDELNKYTQRHLDFYYKEVLQLTNKKPLADAVHLLFELQKPVLKHLLKKNTLFKGGKDVVSGKEINYSLTEDLVLNKATIAKLQSLQVLKGTKEIVNSYPEAASEDGQGAKLNSTDKSWFTFGNAGKDKKADAGFAIASNILFLNEGKRKVTVTVNFAADTDSFAEASPQQHTDYFTAKLTGKKDWHTIKVLEALSTTEGNQLLFSFTLSPDDPAIVPYDEKIHKDNFETALPLLKIYLNQSNPNSYPYRLLSKDGVTSITVNVDVEEVKDLILSSDNGSLDSSKPFKPFGEFPEAGASFYTGSKEIFQKKLTELHFNFASDINYSGDVFYLKQGNWDNKNTVDSGSDTLSSSAGIFPAATMDFSKNEALSQLTLDGFIRIKLASGIYSKQSYLDTVTAQINGTKIQKTTDSTPTYQIQIGTISSPPELILSSFSINYKATTTISLNSSSGEKNSNFFHLTPFGYYKVFYNSDEPSKKISLLPDISNGGELFIGLADAEPEEVINILFQVADGSSNPLRDAENLSWYYLSAANAWLELDSRHIIDRTKNFTQSGIVTITLPLEISNQCTALEKGLHWIKAAVRQYPDAVCKMILVQAQAAQAELVQDELKGIEFRQTLAANSISKFIISDAAVKSLSQPFDSNGGRSKETDEHFYARVSERLRHKQRAITIWDYEHIILEQFPSIFKVKCINHAGFYTSHDNEDVFCENYPGHVTVITIPDFKNKSGINLLRPYTPAGTIRQIDKYLRNLISPFVNLHVKPPQFEEIQLEFNVSFQENPDQSFYRQLLDKEIEKFLTPWAYDAHKEISFGGKIIKSEVLNFVEERPYVDFVTCFKMYHIKNQNSLTDVKTDVEVAVPSTARSLLVSYFNEATKTGHIINSNTSCLC
jgi:hypothetical protein